MNQKNRFGLKTGQCTGLCLVAAALVALAAPSIARAGTVTVPLYDIGRSGPAGYSVSLGALSYQFRENLIELCFNPDGTVNQNAYLEIVDFGAFQTVAWKNLNFYNETFAFAAFYYEVTPNLRTITSVTGTFDYAQTGFDPVSQYVATTPSLPSSSSSVPVSIEVVWEADVTDPLRPQTLYSITNTITAVPSPGGAALLGLGGLLAARRRR
jgi:MYXO-CTERM domain-containing protein